MRRLTENGAGAELLAQAHLWAGFASRLAGANLCFAVIDAGPSQPHTVFLERARDHFTKVLELVPNGTTPANIQLRNAALAGRAIDALETAFARLPGAGAAHLTISGPGYFSVLISAKTRGEADRIGAVSTIGFIVLLLLAYRSPALLLLAALPIASGALAGIAALAWLFGSAHGITLAFGFTLLGVAQEYPIRLLSHRR